MSNLHIQLYEQSESSSSVSGRDGMNDWAFM